MEDILPVKGFEGYFVSKEGRVFSNKKGKLEEMKYYFVPSSSGLTFKSVMLSRNSVVMRKYVHRLVYETFSGRNIKGKRLFFKNFDCLDCSFSNITEEFPPYVLEEGEEWVKGFEGRYTVYKGDVYSVWQKDFPKRLKPSSYFKNKKYTLYNKEGVPFSFYLKIK
ncbi:MAG: hypothetical protein M0R77_07960 [Gammaproteobacteria bacterium]|nr:hypothetical protein [Gammaproteobacteria bacterium]